MVYSTTGNIYIRKNRFFLTQRRGFSNGLGCIFCWECSIMDFGGITIELDILLFTIVSVAAPRLPWTCAVSYIAVLSNSPCTYRVHPCKLGCTVTVRRGPLRPRCMWEARVVEYFIVRCLAKRGGGNGKRPHVPCLVKPPFTARLSLLHTPLL